MVWTSSPVRDVLGTGQAPRSSAPCGRHPERTATDAREPRGSLGRMGWWGLARPGGPAALERPHSLFQDLRRGRATSLVRRLLPCRICHSMPAPVRCHTCDATTPADLVGALGLVEYGQRTRRPGRTMYEIRRLLLTCTGLLATACGHQTAMPVATQSIPSSTPAPTTTTATSASVDLGAAPLRAVGALAAARSMAVLGTLPPAATEEGQRWTLTEMCRGIDSGYFMTKARTWADEKSARVRRRSLLRTRDRR